MALQLARALFAFQGEEASDLSFREDEVITILKKDDSGWWLGQTSDGRKGEFPYNYVEEIQEKDPERAKTASVFMGRGGFNNTAADDTFVSVQVKHIKGTFGFNVEARLKRKKVSAVKTMDDFRRLDEMLRYLYPTYDKPLPPVWADRIEESQKASSKKAKVLEVYLSKMIKQNGNQHTEFALVHWLSPRDSFNCSKNAQEEVRKAFEGAARMNGGRNERNEQQLRNVVLVRAMYPWDPKDAVELPLIVDGYIAVRNKNTLNDGWWEGEDAAGQRGLFPSNYVENLTPAQIQEIIFGGVKRVKQTPAPQNPNPNGFGQAQFGNNNSSKRPAGNREKKVETNFAIPNLEAFDELLNDGFTMLAGNNLFIKAPNANVPTKGNTVSIEYVAYVWDCQNQKLIEFASSDIPSGNQQPGPMTFTVGSGQQIKALERAVMNLAVGQQSRVIVRPDLGFGEAGSPPNNVPPNCHLVYDVTMVNFNAGGGSAGMTAEPNYSSVVQNRVRRNQNTRQTQVNTYNMQETSQNKYSLAELQRIVQEQRFDEYGVNPSFVEDHLTPEGFQEAFNTTPTDFRLMQRWKRSKLKKAVGLY